MLEKRLALFGLFFLIGLFFVSIASAVDVTQTGNSINVVDAVDLYAYEINLDYSGSVNNVNFEGFLSSDGKQTTSSYLADEGVLTVYESRLDGEGKGISGSGGLFDVNLEGEITLRSALLIYSDGNEETISFDDNSTIEEKTECQDGVDNDGDNLIDLNDPGCVNSEDDNEINQLPEEVKISFVPEEISLDLEFGSETTIQVLIYNKGNNDVSLDIGTDGLDSSVEVQDSIFVSAGESKSLDIVVKGDKNRAVVGRLLFSFDGPNVGEIPVMIATSSVNHFFDVFLSIINPYNGVKKGDNLRAQIDLTQLEGTDETPITIYYSLMDFEGNNYLPKNDRETFSILNEASIIKEFEVSDFPIGSYALGIDVVYDGGFKSATEKFAIVEAFSLGPINTGLTKSQFEHYSLFGGIIFFILLFFVIFFVIRMNKSRG